MYCDITLMGRLTKDPEFRKAGSGTGINMFMSIASNWREKRSGQWQDGSAFFNCIVWLKDEDAYAKNYQIFNGRKGEIVVVTGAFRPKAGNGQGQQSMLLAIEFARVHHTWKVDRPAQEVQPQAPVQTTPAYQAPAAPAAPAFQAPAAPAFQAPATPAVPAAPAVAAPVIPAAPAIAPPAAAAPQASWPAPNPTAFPPPPPVTG